MQNSDQTGQCWSSITQDSVTALRISHLNVFRNILVHCWELLRYSRLVGSSWANTKHRLTHSASIQWIWGVWWQGDCAAHANLCYTQIIASKSTKDTRNNCCWIMKPARQEKTSTRPHDRFFGRDCTFRCVLVGFGVHPPLACIYTNSISDRVGGERVSHS